MSLTWNHTRQLGALLFEKYDTLNPHSAKLSDIHKWVLDLEDFEGHAEQPEDRILEAVRKAWYEEWKREFGR